MVNFKRTLMSLDRRLAQFQAKVQQKIMLADDKVRRSEDYLDSLQAEIKEIEDKLRRFQTQTEQHMEVQNGRKRTQNARKQAQIGSLASEHNAYVAEMLGIHKTESETLNEEFEGQVAAMDQYIEKKTDARISPIVNQIERTAGQIAKLKEEHQNNPGVRANDNDGDDFSENSQADRIKHLENLLHGANSQRLDSLVAARSQLSECVETLEEMEGGHEIAMTNLRQHIGEIDSRYEEKVISSTSKHRMQSDALKRKIREAETKATQTQKAMKLSERHFKKEITQISDENAQLRAQITNLNGADLSKRNGDTSPQSDGDNRQTLKRQLQERESVLLKVRSDSSALKREIGRISHDKALTERRTALNLI
jgi:chromosome segregation ATPase